MNCWPTCLPANQGVAQALTRPLKELVGLWEIIGVMRGGHPYVLTFIALKYLHRSPVVIFLSDGACSVSDNKIYDLAQRSQALGTPLVFHSVSFGPDGSSGSLRRMSDIAAEVHARAPPNPLAGPGAGSCTYTEAIDTVTCEPLLALSLHY